MAPTQPLCTDHPEMPFVGQVAMAFAMLAALVAGAVSMSRLAGAPASPRTQAAVAQLLAELPQAQRPVGEKPISGMTQAEAYRLQAELRAAKRAQL